MIHTVKPAFPQHGDLLIYSVSDSVGRENRRGRHTNFGYSGYVILLIWDSKHWARLTKKFVSSIGVQNTSFAYRYEEPSVKEHVITCVERYMHNNPEHKVKSWWWEGKKYADLTPIKRAEPQSDSATKINGELVTN